jgi:hypothetical protein
MKWRLPFGDLGRRRGTPFNTVLLKEDEMYAVCAEHHNPPTVGDINSEAAFQAEIRLFYTRLVGSLSVLGEEGDYYGISDFCVRPDLRDRPTVRPPPAFPTREFVITVMTEKFYRSDFLRVIKRFLETDGQQYRVTIDQDFETKWVVRMYLTLGTARVYCNDASELAELLKRLTR